MRKRNAAAPLMPPTGQLDRSQVEACSKIITRRWCSRRRLDALSHAARVVGNACRADAGLPGGMASSVAVSETAASDAKIQRLRNHPTTRSPLPQTRRRGAGARRADAVLPTSRSPDEHHRLHPHTTRFGRALPDFFAQAPALLGSYALGPENWVAESRNRRHPEQQKDYFGLHSTGSQAVLAQTPWTCWPTSAWLDYVCGLAGPILSAPTCLRRNASQCRISTGRHSPARRYDDAPGSRPLSRRLAHMSATAAGAWVRSRTSGLPAAGGGFFGGLPGRHC